jgi:hypothetical protein
MHPSGSPDLRPLRRHEASIKNTGLQSPYCGAKGQCELRAESVEGSRVGPGSSPSRTHGAVPLHRREFHMHCTGALPLLLREDRVYHALSYVLHELLAAFGRAYAKGTVFQGD